MTSLLTRAIFGHLYYVPQSPYVNIAHHPAGVIRLEVTAFVGVHDAIQATFDLYALACLDLDVAAPRAKPFISACDQNTEAKANRVD